MVITFAVIKVTFSGLAHVQTTISVYTHARELRITKSFCAHKLGEIFHLGAYVQNLSSQGAQLLYFYK